MNSPIRLARWWPVMEGGPRSLRLARSWPARVIAGDWREYERPLPEVMVALARSFPGAFYDVGANIGIYSCLVGRVSSSTVIRSFEPMPFLVTACRANLSANGVTTEVVDVALSEADGIAVLCIPVRSGTEVETSASLNPDFKPDIESTVEVVSRTLDSFRHERGDQVAVVKIDVEGAEHLVLRGAHQTMDQDRPLVIIEILPGFAGAEIESFLHRHDCVLVPLWPDGRFEIADRVEFHREAWNQMIVPRERFERVREVATDRQLVDDALVSLNAESAWSKLRGSARVLAMQVFGR